MRRHCTWHNYTQLASLPVKLDRLKGISPKPDNAIVIKVFWLAWSQTASYSKTSSRIGPLTS